MSFIVTKRLINTEDYYKMAETGMLKPDENVELINGEIYTMSPIGIKHATVVDHLSALMIHSLADIAKVRIQNPIHIDQWNELEPDLTIMKFRKDRYVTAHPKPAEILMVIEVSDTSYDIDRKMKLPIYASAGIPVYWIINLSENRIEIYEEPMDDLYRKTTLHVPGDKISIQDKSFDVAEILLKDRE